MKRTFCIALALLVAVSLFLPLPAAAGGFGKQEAAQGWEGVWTGLLDWLGLLPSVEADSSFIDPFGQPHATPPGWVTGEDSSSIDPFGHPAFSEDSPSGDRTGSR